MKLLAHHCTSPDREATVVEADMRAIVGDDIAVTLLAVFARMLVTLPAVLDEHDVPSTYLRGVVEGIDPSCLGMIITVVNSTTGIVTPRECPIIKQRTTNTGDTFD